MSTAPENFNLRRSVTVLYNYRSKKKIRDLNVAIIVHPSVNIPRKFILFYRRNGYFSAAGSVHREEKQLQLKDIPDLPQPHCSRHFIIHIESRPGLRPARFKHRAKF